MTIPALKAATPELTLATSAAERVAGAPKLDKASASYVSGDTDNDDETSSTCDSCLA